MSKSSCIVPTLLVSKNGEFRVCMDNRAINRITIKYRFLIPRIDDLLADLSGETIFSKLDGYHHIRIKAGDEWKIAFMTKLNRMVSHIFWAISDAPSIFMRLMIQVLQPSFGICVVVYFDDILIYSKDQQSKPLEAFKRSTRSFAN